MTKVYSERVGAHVHLGKQPAKAMPDAIAFHEVRKMFLAAGGTLPEIPADWLGYGSDFTEGAIADGGWGMLGNGPCDDGSIPEGWAAYEGAGDCAWAGPAHETMEAAKNGGRPVPKFTALNVLHQYSEYGGYNLQNGENDNGSAVADVVKWRQTKGLVDADGGVHKIGPAITLTPGDIKQLWEATYLLDCVGMGWNITQANMDQFDENKPWSYVKGAQSIGGHYTPNMAKLITISWARPTPFTESFVKEQNDEAVGYIDPTRYSTVTGDDANGLNDIDVEKYFALLPAFR